MFGPNVSLMATNHPLIAHERVSMKYPDGHVSMSEYADEIHIGNNVWDVYKRQDNNQKDQDNSEDINENKDRDSNGEQDSEDNNEDELLIGQPKSNDTPKTSDAGVGG